MSTNENVNCLITIEIEKKKLMKEFKGDKNSAIVLDAIGECMHVTFEEIVEYSKLNKSDARKATRSLVKLGYLYRDDIDTEEYATTYRIIHEDYAKLQTQLNLAFMELSNNGFLARQDFNIDMCGELADIDEEVSKRIDKSKYKGYVFSLSKATESLKQYAELCLVWGSVDGYSNEKKNQIVDIGKSIVKILKKFNIEVNWNETANERITVSLKKNPKVKK